MENVRFFPKIIQVAAQTDIPRNAINYVAMVCQLSSNLYTFNTGYRDAQIKANKGGDFLQGRSLSLPPPPPTKKY